MKEPVIKGFLEKTGYPPNFIYHFRGNLVLLDIKHQYIDLCLPQLKIDSFFMQKHYFCSFYKKHYIESDNGIDNQSYLQ